MANDWRNAALGDVCQLRAGSVFPPALQGKSVGNYPFVKVSDMNLASNVVRIQDANNWVDDEDLRQLKAKPFPPGTTVFAKIGEALKANRLRYIIRPTIIDNNMMGAIPAPDIVDSCFFHYALSKFDFGEVAGGSALPYLTVGALSKLEIAIPPLHEQRAIANILGTLDDKIELNRKESETLEAMARTLFKAWFVDFEPVRAKMEGRWQRGQSLPGLPAHLYDLFPDSLVESELGEIPEGWRVGPLEDLLVLQRGFDLPTQSRIEGPFPVIAAGGVNGTHHQAMVKGPGVVTGRSGVLGNVFLELGDYWPLNTTLWVKEFRAAKPCYAYELLRGFDFKMFNAGSAVPTLNRNHIHVVPQIIPPSEVIGIFEDMAMVLHQDIVANNRESSSLSQLRDTLLPKLVSGELRVPDAERIVEEASP